MIGAGVVAVTAAGAAVVLAAVAISTARRVRLAPSSPPWSVHRTLVENCADALVLIGDDATVMSANTALDTVAGFPHGLLVGHRLSALVPPSQVESVDIQIAGALELPIGSSTTFDLDVVTAQRTTRIVEVVAVRCAAGPGGAPGGVVATLRDVTDHRATAALTDSRAFRDDLTGLANRSLFLDRVDQALRRRASQEDPSVAVLTLDLDGFTDVNLTRGRDAGDELLQAVGYRLVGCMRSGDTVARTRGDEFAVLLEGRASAPEAHAAAERVLEVLSLPLDVKGEPLAVQASLGLAVASPGATTESLLRSADIAMLHAKRTGKARIVVHQDPPTDAF